MQLPPAPDDSLSEDDVSVKFITPAIVGAGWDETTQIRRQVSFTKGRIIVRGRLVSRGKAKKADFVLYWQHVPIALIEAKKASFAAGHGMQQALGYASALHVPYVFSSNGRGFVLHDRTGLIAMGETDLAMNAFPSPDLLWAKYREWKGLTAAQEKVVLEPYFDDGSGKEPRYYQRNAINAAVEAIAKGQDRVLLVMATGTGKTYTAFQIIWRLWKSDWHAGRQKRVLFLADRNILIDQTMVNDFRPFGAKMSAGMLNRRYSWSPFFPRSRGIIGWNFAEQACDDSFTRRSGTSAKRANSVFDGAHIGSMPANCAISVGCSSRVDANGSDISERLMTRSPIAYGIARTLSGVMSAT